MAWVATNKDGNTCAICSADPDNAITALKKIQQWRRDGSTIELLPVAEAKDKFLAELDRKSPFPPQPTLF